MKTIDDFIKDQKIVCESTFKNYYEFDSEFLSFCKKNNITPPKLNTIKGQVIALMTCQENHNKLVTRELLNQFLDIIGMKSKDIVQAINKTEQWGLESTTYKRMYYTIPYPFSYVDIHIKKRKIKKTGNKDEQIDLIKEWISKNYLEVPNNKWELGHMDPNNPNPSENDIVYQPPIQGRYRDRFKYDKLGLTKYPTPQELDENFDKYYSEEEQKKLYQILKKKFDN